MANNYLKPQEPLHKINKETGDKDYFYPLVTDDQVILEDGSRLNAFLAGYEEAVSPTVSVSKSGTVTTVTITDKEGTKTAKINDGTSGKTPVKGTDYFTEADKAEIVEETVENIPTASADRKGLVKVGDGLTMSGDVLNIHDNWELINSVTTTEEVSIFRITQDSNGNPFALKKAIFKVIAPATTEKRRCILMVNSDYGQLAYSADTQPKTTMLWVEVVNGKLTAIQHGCSPTSRAGQSADTSLYYPLLNNKEAENINYFHIEGVSGVIIPIGTIIEIWGVRI